MTMYDRHFSGMDVNPGGNYSHSQKNLFVSDLTSLQKVKLTPGYFKNGLFWIKFR